jgi:hypothetical protein
MYAWYQDSAVCYVYLHDVGDDEDPQSGFEKAEWFQRGWTLQELIAPDNVYFFNKDWVKIGSKATFARILNQITHVRRDILLGKPCNPSIAEKMSWAAGRQTQKIEDRAYSLMGLFDVHMPIIYGEGDKAFRRLQLEIMKSSDDQSIFAWHDSYRHPNSVGDRGVLASSPTGFSLASPVVTMEHSQFIDILHRVTGKHKPFCDLPDGYSILNDGIHITLPMKKVTDGWLAVLRCKREDKEFPCGIYLKEISGCDGFLRTSPTKLQVLRHADLKTLVPRKICIVVDHHTLPTIKRKQFFTLQSTDPVWKHCGYYLCPNPGNHHGVGNYRVLDPNTRIELSDDVRCACIYSQGPYDKVTVLLIRIEHHRPWVHLLTHDNLHLYVDTSPLRIRRQTIHTPMSSPTSTQSSNQADSSASSLPSSLRFNSIDSSPSSLSPSSTSARTDNYGPLHRRSTPQLHRDGTGCPVCSIIQNYSIDMDDEIKNPRVDFVFKTILDKQIKVDIRKGQVRRVSEAMLEVNYVITVDLSPSAAM